MPDVVAFATEHVCRLTGLSVRQLRYWDSTAFFSPTLLKGHRGRPFGRIYSFRDLVGLRTISILRRDHAVPLQELRKVGAWLRREHETPWSSLKFGIAGRTVVFFDPHSGEAVEPRGAGQEVMAIALQPIAEEMRGAAAKLTRRTRAQIGQRTRNRYVVHNAWVVAGTRIPTAAIWRFHEAGFSTTRILREYPRLRRADVESAIRFERERHQVA